MGFIVFKLLNFNVVLFLLTYINLWKAMNSSPATISGLWSIYSNVCSLCCRKIHVHNSRTVILNGWSSFVSTASVLEAVVAQPSVWFSSHWTMYEAKRKLHQWMWCRKFHFASGQSQREWTTFKHVSIRTCFAVIIIRCDCRTIFVYEARRSCEKQWRRVD